MQVFDELCGDTNCSERNFGENSADKEDPHGVPILMDLTVSSAKTISDCNKHNWICANFIKKQYHKTSRLFAK